MYTLSINKKRKFKPKKYQIDANKLKEIEALLDKEPEKAKKTVIKLVEPKKQKEAAAPAEVVTEKPKPPVPPISSKPRYKASDFPVHIGDYRIYFNQGKYKIYNKSKYITQYNSQEEAIRKIQELQK
jgi:hypothetical protein